MKKSNVIGLTIGIIIVIVAVSLISWFAIKPVPNFIQGEVAVSYTHLDVYKRQLSK